MLQQLYFDYFRISKNKKTNDEEINIDLTKLKIGNIEKKNPNDTSEYSEATKLQVNEDALVINCPVCGTANVIDENNQTFQCFFCSSSLL